MPAAQLNKLLPQTPRNNSSCNLLKQESSQASLIPKIFGNDFRHQFKFSRKS